MDNLQPKTLKQVRFQYLLWIQEIYQTLNHCRRITNTKKRNLSECLSSKKVTLWLWHDNFTSKELHGNKGIIFSKTKNQTDQLIIQHDILLRNCKIYGRQPSSTGCPIKKFTLSQLCYMAVIQSLKLYYCISMNAMLKIKSIFINQYAH